MRIIRKIHLFLHCLIGIGAMAGGLAAILDPLSPMGIPVSALNGHFASFLIPGLFLFFILGTGNLICAFLYRIPHPVFVYGSGMMGAILLYWIIIQCYILQTVAALHVIFAFLGIIQGTLALVMLIGEKRFPFNRMFRAASKPGKTGSRDFQ